MTDIEKKNAPVGNIETRKKLEEKLAKMEKFFDWIKNSKNSDVQGLLKKFEAEEGENSDKKEQASASVVSATKKIESDMKAETIIKNIKLNFPMYNVRLHRPSKSEVIGVLSVLPNPYGAQIAKYMNQGDISGLQKYINEENKAFGEKNGIKLSPIAVDNKFGDQTFGAIKDFMRARSSVELASELHRIKESMKSVIRGVEDTDTNQDWKSERNEHLSKVDDNYMIDTDKKIIALATWGKEIEGPCEKFDIQNMCSYHRETGKMDVKCGNKTYEFPMNFGKMIVDKNGNPEEGKQKNDNIIRSVTAIANLLNRLKSGYVFNHPNDAIYFDQNYQALRLDNWKNTDLVEGDSLKKMFAKNSMNMTNEDGVKIASMLSAMKIDVNNLERDDVDKNSFQRHFSGGTDEEHRNYIKQYMKTSR